MSLAFSIRVCLSNNFFSTARIFYLHALNHSLLSVICQCHRIPLWITESIFFAIHVKIPIILTLNIFAGSVISGKIKTFPVISIDIVSLLVVPVFIIPFGIIAIIIIFCAVFMKNVKLGRLNKMFSDCIQTSPFDTIPERLYQQLPRGAEKEGRQSWIVLFLSVW